MNSIIPNRGIRQGDPLSPFIFILCSQIFSRLVERNNDIQGIKICKRAPAISHLYSDDTLVAYHANSQNAKAIQEVLNVYSHWSGQLPNFDKSKILFSKNTLGMSKMAIKELLEFKELKSGFIYLVDPWTNPWILDIAGKIPKIKIGAEEALAWRVADLLNPYP
ncbi:hypothetical protein FEM48_Zijuj10G0152700 [Ziziphus jujuba var. spinosa]|uniref:Mitochondrial protein n=1 Tax=Ziziphus jujuba var. spinosa TaxID=714518 RepID=A0A978UP52_ZIZJJ|nr:hypothetical protein FEM48_Zijuj10G0152700 [Ziziphus jujuba var. spinosa]